MKVAVQAISSRIIRFLIFAVLGLILANTLGLLSRYALQRGNLLGLVPLFQLDVEGNIPTWYSSSTLLICSILLGIIAFIKKQVKDLYHRHWSGLSIIFLLLSIEEGVGLRENNALWRSVFNTGGYLYFAWVIPGAIFSLLVLLLYLRFLADLPAKTRNLFILAGSFYVIGSIGLEIIGAPLWELHGKETLAAAIITTLEESFEMIGVLTFIYALLSYLSFYVKEIKLTIRENEQ